MSSKVITGSIPSAASAKQRVPPIYLLATAIGLALALVYGVITANSLAGVTDIRAYLTRTAFPAFITGATLVDEGQGDHLYDAAAQEKAQQSLLAPYNYPGGLLPYNHLPFLAVLLSLVAGLPLDWSFGLWLGATTLALLAALALLTREIRELARSEQEARWATIGLWALAAGFFPVYHELSQAQTAAWVLLGFTAGVRLLRQQQDTKSGLFFFSALIKPQIAPLPLLALLVERRWKALCACAGLTLVLLALVTPFLGGPGWIPNYAGWLLNISQGGSNGNIHPVLMENWRGFFALLLGDSSPLVTPFFAIATLVYLALLAWCWLGVIRRGGKGVQYNSAAWDLRWAATIMTALLVSPHLLGYELTIWLLVGALVWRAARQPGGPAPKQVALMLACGFWMGTLALPLISAGLIPVHLGALFMALTIPILVVWSRKAEQSQAEVRVTNG